MRPLAAYPRLAAAYLRRRQHRDAEVVRLLGSIERHLAVLAGREYQDEAIRRRLADIEDQLGVTTRP